VTLELPTGLLGGGGPKFCGLMVMGSYHVTYHVFHLVPSLNFRVGASFSTHFPPQNSRRQKSDMGQVAYGGLKNYRHHRSKCSCHSNVAPEIGAALR
jgi:hypothetical protein